MIKVLYKLSFLVFLLTFLPIGLHSQTVQLLNNRTQKPVEDVLIYGEKSSVVSNDEGIVHLDEFNENDTLIIQHPSYLNIVLPKTSFYSPFILQERNIQLGEITIVDKHIRASGAAGLRAITSESVTALELEQGNFATSVDALQANGGLFIQKSQAGGGSPVIRGFEASRVLLVIDGVRMNNAIYRSGHLQNAVTVDNNIIENIDVHFGPSSVVYGSDALGGVVHFHTKTPKFSINDSTHYIDANAYVRYASANNERTAHADFTIGGNKISSFTSATYTLFDDLKMGEVRAHGYEDYGKIFQYIKTENGKDVVVENNDPNTHPNTGYSQLDLIEKLRFKVNNDNILTANFQYSTSSDINRTDRLLEIKGNAPKFAEWYYGPQNRFLAAFNWENKNSTKLFNQFNVITAFQNIQESRFKRKTNFDNLSPLDRQIEDVQVYSINIDFFKIINKKQRLFYGLESSFNNVLSAADAEDLISGEKTPIDTRYPNGSNNYVSNAIYIAYRNAFSDQLTLNTGIRWNHIYLNSQFDTTYSYELPFNKIEFNNQAISGSVNLDYQPNGKWRIQPGFSTGFRSPNIDDAGKVREKGGFAQIPNPDINPEYAYNSEVNIVRHLWDKKVSIQGVAFYTFINNAIVIRDTQLNGNDSLLIDGDLAKVQHNTNANNAVIYGFSSKLQIRANKFWGIESSINLTKGEDDQGIPLAHIPPLYGKTSVSYKKEKLTFNLYSLYNASKSIVDFAPGSTDNPDFATVDGSVDWFTLNLKSSFRLNKLVTFYAGIENILDHHYRSFASALSAPGRNFITSIKVNL